MASPRPTTAPSRCRVTRMSRAAPSISFSLASRADSLVGHIPASPCATDRTAPALINLNLMILPFVREIFAELEHSSGFDRVSRHLSLGTGRRRVSGLTSTARSLYIPLMARAAKRPVIVVVADNKAADALEPLLKAGCELT